MRQLFLEGRALHIFPCRADKRPCTPHGHLDAVSDAESIAALWARYPSAPLVGVPTGAIGGIDVLDIDPNGEGWFQAHRDQLPQTLTHETRREGWHLKGDDCGDCDFGTVKAQSNHSQNENDCGSSESRTAPDSSVAKTDLEQEIWESLKKSKPR
jgi:hypothetical protein